MPRAVKFMDDYLYCKKKIHKQQLLFLLPREAPGLAFGEEHHMYRKHHVQLGLRARDE